MLVLSTWKLVLCALLLLQALGQSLRHHYYPVIAAF
jgi:hypothetical protein